MQPKHYCYECPYKQKTAVKNDEGICIKEEMRCTYKTLRLGELISDISECPLTKLPNIQKCVICGRNEITKYIPGENNGIYFCWACQRALLELSKKYENEHSKYETKISTYTFGENLKTAEEILSEPLTIWV